MVTNYLTTTGQNLESVHTVTNYLTTGRYLESVRTVTNSLTTGRYLESVRRPQTLSPPLDTILSQVPLQTTPYTYISLSLVIFQAADLKSISPTKPYISSQLPRYDWLHKLQKFLLTYGVLILHCIRSYVMRNQVSLFSLHTGGSELLAQIQLPHPHPHPFSHTKPTI